MKFTFVFIFIYSLMSVLIHAKAQNGQAIKAMTYNIRYDNPADSPNWNQRKKHVIDLVIFHDVMVLGVQEALHHQLDDMVESMEGYDWVGKGRDDGKEEGEYSAIFFKKDFFDLLETETFWLSLTPEQPSKSWDAALPRVCTWAKLNNRKTNTAFFVFNTHFDHVGTEARLNSTKLLIEKVNEIAGEAPFIIMGDFNYSPDSEPYQYFVREEKVFDAQDISQTGHYGPEGTFNGFNFHEPLGEKIDHIFVNNRFDVLKHGVISDSYELNYPSDHLPVLAELVFNDDNITSRERWYGELKVKQEFDPKLTLFTGSSSIRLWPGLSKSLKNRKVINMGFGGSEIRDLILNADRVIFKYYPKHIVIYSGDNDIWSGKSASLVAKDFKELYHLIRDKLPETEIIFISIKPSPSRLNKIEDIKSANHLIQNFLDNEQKGHFIDVFDAMLDESGNPNPVYFSEDNLHLNPKGYDLWTKLIIPYLRN